MDSDTKTCAGSYGACREAMLEILGAQTDDVVDGDDIYIMMMCLSVCHEK